MELHGRNKSIFGINKAIELVQREIYNSEYLLTKDKLRSSSSNVFIVFENIIKELLHIYSYLLYGNDYEDKLTYSTKQKKLMLGSAIENSYKINENLKYNNILIEKIERDYCIFNDKDYNYRKCKEITYIRGKVIHDDIQEFKNLDEYKRVIVKTMNLCIDVLRDFKSKGIFPRLFQFKSLVESKEMVTVNYIDEIGSVLPINYINKNNTQSFKGQVYILKLKNDTKIIPAKIKLNHLQNELIDSSYINIYDDEYDLVEKLYLKVSDREEIVPLLLGRKSFGRHIENDIIFKYRSISRRQCIFEVNNEGVFIVDLDSTFGTRINNEKIEPFKKILINEKDQIEIGEKKETIKISVMKAR